MKKYLIILGAILLTISLTATTLVNKDKDDIEQIVTTNYDEPEFIYDIGTRFAPIKLSAIKNATSIKDFLDHKELNAIEELQSTSLIIFKDEKQSDIRAYGSTTELSSEQLELIKSFNISTNFGFRVEFLGRNLETGNLENNYRSPHLTVVPEKQAYYSDGKVALMDYLRSNSKDTWEAINPEKLQPAKLFFTVTKTGKVTSIRLDRTSNFPSVDTRMIELMSDIPGEFIPAEDMNGNKVEQELVVSFGLIGC